MKVWQIADSFGLENLRQTEMAEPSPGLGEIKIRIQAASLNYRDLIIVEGKYGKVIKPPIVPLSDAVGQVVEIGPDVTRFKVGDRACPIFFQDWIAGEPREDILRQETALGTSLNGVLGEFKISSEQCAVRVPEYLTDEEAAALPCAAVTAWNALTYGQPVRPGETVLIQGTGGVAIFALQFSKMMGARVVIMSSSEDKMVKAIELGADAAINYRTTEAWHHEVRRSVPSGVDRVIEVGGGDTLDKSLKSVRAGGTISLVGVLSGGKALIDLPLVVMRRVRLEGITVGSRSDFEAMLRAMEYAELRPQIGEFDFVRACAGGVCSDEIWRYIRKNLH